MQLFLADIQLMMIAAGYKDNSYIAYNGNSQKWFIRTLYNTDDCNRCSFKIISLYVLYSYLLFMCIAISNCTYVAF